MRLLAITGLLVLVMVALVMILGPVSKEVPPASAASPQGSGPVEDGAPSTRPCELLRLQPRRSMQATRREATVLPARVLGEVVGELPARAYVVAEDAMDSRRIELQGNHFELETSTLGVLNLRLEGIPRCVSEPVEVDIIRLGAEYAALLTVTPLPTLAIRFVDSQGGLVSSISHRTPPLVSETLAAIATRRVPRGPVELEGRVGEELRSELGAYSDLRGAKVHGPDGEQAAGCCWWTFHCQSWCRPCWETGCSPRGPSTTTRE